MKALLLNLLLVFLSLPLFSQFTPELVATYHYGDAKGLVYAGDDDFVFLDGGELFHLKMDSTLNVTIEELESNLDDLQRIQLFDFDLDNDLDIIAYTPNSGKLYTFEKQEGSYVYQLGQHILPTTPRYFYVHDFNQDGWNDLFYNGTIFTTQGPNDFEAGISFSTSIDQPFNSVHFGDFDEDGDQDIFCHYLSTLFVILNEGDNLTRVDLPGSSESPNWARVIEVNDKPIILYQRIFEDKIRRLEFDGANFLSKVVLDPQFPMVDPPVVADLDEDGDEELATYGATEIQILGYDADLDTLLLVKTQVTGGIKSMVFWPKDPEPSLLLNKNLGIEGYSINESLEAEKSFESIQGIGIEQFVDVDGDGFTDILDFTGFANGYHVKRYLGNFIFDKTINLNFPINGGDFRDFDGDGDLDLLQETGWYEQTGTLLFDDLKPKLPDTLPYPDPQIFFTKIALVDDLDMDGDLDIVSYNAFGEDVMIHENVNNEYFEDGFTIAVWQDISGDLRYIEALDLDLDGDKDLLMAADAAMVWFETLGPLQFSSANNLHGLPYEPWHVDVADINQDSFPDIVMGTTYNSAGSTSGFVELFLGSAEGPSSFATIHSGEGSHKCAFADINTDGRTDIVYLHDNAMYWVEMLPDSSFEQTFIDGNFGINNRFLAEDVDSDGDTDLITWCGTCYAPIPNQDNRISYYINSGDSAMLFPCPSGDVYLENQQEIIEFGQKYSHCPVIEGDLYVGLQTLTWADITNLEGLANVVEVKGDLTLWYVNKLSNFEGLRNLEQVGGTLQVRGYKQKDMKGLEKLQSIGQDFHLHNCFSTGSNGAGELDSLRNLSHVGGNLHFEASYITSAHMPAFQQDTIHGTARFYGVRGYNNLEFMESVEVVEQDLRIEDCELASVEGLKNVKWVGNDLVIRWSFGDPNFSPIWTIIPLHDDLVVAQNWDMYSNNRLQYCNIPPLCNHIASGKPYTIYGNGFMCNDVQTIGCRQTGFSGLVYHDANGNGQHDAGEAPLSSMRLTSKNRFSNNPPDTLFTDTEGIYADHFAVGDSVEIRLLLPTGWTLTTSPEVYTDTFSLNNPGNSGNNFGLQPLDFEMGMSTHLFSTQIVCDQGFQLQAQVKNRSSLPENGFLRLTYPNTLELDPSYNSFDSHDPQTGVLTWNFLSLSPYQLQSVNPRFLEPGDDQVGTTFNFLLEALIDSAGNEVLAASSEFTHILGCSYEANDKLVEPIDENGLSEIEAEEWLTYTIRFQNTWDSPAPNLVVIDQLSEYLDPSTFELLETSHSALTTLDERELRFIFLNINLPDSASDFLGSQGFVTFRIKPFPGLADQSVIENNALMAFMGEWTIWTPEVFTTIMATPTSVVQPLTQPLLRISPMVASSYFLMDWLSPLPAGGHHYTLYDLHGRVQRSGTVQSRTTVMVEGLPPGLYILGVNEKGSENRIAIKKIIIH